MNCVVVAESLGGECKAPSTDVVVPSASTVNAAIAFERRADAMQFSWTGYIT